MVVSSPVISGSSDGAVEDKHKKAAVGDRRGQRETGGGAKFSFAWEEGICLSGHVLSCAGMGVGAPRSDTVALCFVSNRH